MKTPRFLIASAALCGLVFTLSSTGHAWVWGGYRWPTREVPYYVNPANADVSEAAALAAIQAGAAAWQTQSHADFRFVYAGYTSGSSLQMNYRNEVFFRNEDNGRLVAETLRWFDGSGNLLDTDIVFYDGGWRFFTGSSGCSNGVYIEDFAAHEFGHALGLKHSADSSATMYATGKNCSTAWRSLEADDIAGVEALYPPAAKNTSPSVVVDSPSSGTTVVEGQAVTFSGSATDKEDGNLSSSLVWTSSRDGRIGTGASFSRVLSRGTHAITAEVTDANGQSSSASVTIAVEAISTNQPPSVSIAAPSSGTSVAEGTSITFRGSGSDAEDGDLSSKLVWTSSLDGTLAMGSSFSRALSPGSHTIRATVSDSAGSSSSAQIGVTVLAQPAPPPPPDPAPAEFWLSADANKIKGLHYGDLEWGGASSAKVDIYRDGVKVGTTANDGSHRDAINRRGSASYTYRVCEAGTATCSNAVVIRF